LGVNHLVRKSSNQKECQLQGKLWGNPQKKKVPGWGLLCLTYNLAPAVWGKKQKGKKLKKFTLLGQRCAGERDPFDRGESKKENKGGRTPIRGGNFCVGREEAIV